MADIVPNDSGSPPKTTHPTESADTADTTMNLSPEASKSKIKERSPSGMHLRSNGRGGASKLLCLVDKPEVVEPLNIQAKLNDPNYIQIPGSSVGCDDTWTCVKKIKDNHYFLQSPSGMDFSSKVKAAEHFIEEQAGRGEAASKVGGASEGASNPGRSDDNWPGRLHQMLLPHGHHNPGQSDVVGGASKVVMASFDEASILVAATELMESKARDFRKRADRIRKEERRKETAPEATAKSAPEGEEGGGEGGAPVAVPEWGVSEAVGMEGVVTAPAVTAPVVPATAPSTSTESEAQAATTLNGEMCTASSNGGGEVGKYDMMLMMMMTDEDEGKFMV